MFAKVKYLLAIGLLFLIPACATGQTTGSSAVDIDATVEARVASILTPKPQIVIQEVTSTPTPISPTVIPTAIPPTATPLPLATATPLPPTATPVTPTATPIPPTATPVPPTPEEKAENIAKEGQEWLSLDTTTVTDNLPHIAIPKSDGYRNDGEVTFTDNLITNTHPDFNMKINFISTVFDGEGFIIGGTNYEGGCIRPNETWRYRERIHVKGMDSENYSMYFNENRVETEIVANILKEEDLEFILTDNSWARCYSQPNHYIPDESSASAPIEKEIDKSLLNEVELIITIIEPPFKPHDWNEWGTYTVEIKNRSANEVRWQGKYEIKDEFGYILHRDERILVVGANQRHTIRINWEDRWNFHTSDHLQKDQYRPFMHVYPHCFYVDYEGNQCSDLGVEFPTLVTTYLKAR